LSSLVPLPNRRVTLSRKERQDLLPIDRLNEVVRFQTTFRLARFQDRVCDSTGYIVRPLRLFRHESLSREPRGPTSMRDRRVDGSDQAADNSLSASHSRKTRAPVIRSKNWSTESRPFSLLHFWHDSSQFDSSSAPPSTCGTR
jgi:hypothetical protein